MAVLNFGSLNLDYVYAVDHIVLPGETISSTRLDVFCGGKGLNQSVALARAGVKVAHAGMIGPDGDALLEACRKDAIDGRHILRVRERTGNAIIQVDADGRNSIVLFGGANRANHPDHVARVLASYSAGDTVLLQNEISLLAEIVDAAHARGMRIVLNPSPFDGELSRVRLEKVSLFIMNEVEGWQMTGEREPERILGVMAGRYPGAEILLTLGGEGSVYLGGGETARQAVFPVPVVDTTAAGDTFTGYFVASRLRGLPVARSLRVASFAASLAVSRPGAADSIPALAEVEAGLA